MTSREAFRLRKLENGLECIMEALKEYGMSDEQISNVHDCLLDDIEYRAEEYGPLPELLAAISDDEKAVTI